MFRIATVALLLAVATPALAQSTQIPSNTPVIVTHGDATVKKAPDRAWISVSVETRDPKAADARSRNAESMTAVQSALKGAGVPADAIRTTGYSLSPDMEYNNGRSTLKGYVVRNDIEVRVDDLNKLSDLLDVVNVTKGVGLTVNGPRFDLKNQQSAENEALRQAVEMAMARAQAIAGGARRTVGAILRVEDSSGGGNFPGPIPMMAARAQFDKVATPITPGEIEIRADVTLTVEMK
jgi:uncharacterized protein YggE